MSIMIITQRKEIAPWVKALQERRPALEIRVYPDGGNYDDVTFALAWNHPLGAFREFRNLKCIASMGAGVDHIMKDPDLPEDAVITKVTDENLTNDMAAFTLGLVLQHVRGLSEYEAQQRQHIWRRKAYKRAEDVTVGVMGMGVLGAHVARVLRQTGFRVNGWATAAKPMEGIKVYAGEGELSAFLAQSDILICLLPLTKETAGILNRGTFGKLPKGAYVINVARGEHLVDEDLLYMLDAGHLSGASLDVFREEPLPAGHPFWRHPRIHITPHIASVTDPETVVPQILDNYDRLQRNEPLINVVSRQKGY
ncbi:glyoxylate/hydroxypyruvate reductase A [Pontibacter saemangeumensis]|uniref:Glyoxylate/hydroxypyruvate reductase A n=2 Tax=Pontibacter saemangeumensis TaxID=1084525 RepID=A0ABP8LUU8_9BACT